MNHFLLYKIANILGLLATVFIVISAYIFFSGESLVEKKATVVCAKIINTNIGSDFRVLNVRYRKFFTLIDAKATLKIVYNNGREATADCVFKRNYKNDIIIVKKASIIDSKGALQIFDDILVKDNN